MTTLKVVVEDIVMGSNRSLRKVAGFYRGHMILEWEDTGKCEILYSPFNCKPIDHKWLFNTATYGEVIKKIDKLLETKKHG